MAMRRLTPDPAQLQVIVGSLLGDGRLSGPRRARQLSVAHRRDAYARWKHDLLGSFVAAAPVRAAGITSFATIAHPLFDDLAELDQAGLLELAGPLGIAVWLADLGRLELRLDSFCPTTALALRRRGGSKRLRGEERAAERRDGAGVQLARARLADPHPDPRLPERQRLAVVARDHLALPVR